MLESVIQAALVLIIRRIIIVTVKGSTERRRTIFPVKFLIIQDFTVSCAGSIRYNFFHRSVARLLAVAWRTAPIISVVDNDNDISPRLKDLLVTQLSCGQKSTQQHDGAR
jgi:hypothetical protein